MATPTSSRYKAATLTTKREEFLRSHLTGVSSSKAVTAGGDQSSVMATPPVNAPSAPSYSSLTEKSKFSSLKNADSNGSLTSHQSAYNYVGFSSLPNQAYRSAVRRGVDFNLMVVGPSGCGKSTFVNTLLEAEVYGADYNGPSARIGKTVRVDKTQILLRESTVSVRLTVIDTPGFGDAIDNTNCWDPLIDYIDKTFEEYLTAEMRVNRQAIHDSRVHCCLYFIQAGLHGLRQIDIDCLKKLCTKVNVVPVISKADTMTAEELKHFKALIMAELATNQIKVYTFPELAGSDDAFDVPLGVDKSSVTSGRLTPGGGGLQRVFRERQPFAVVGSNCRLELPGGRVVRARRYPWGVVEVENPDHNDFLALRTLLIRTHLPHLKDVTHTAQYEVFRQDKLAATLSIPGAAGAIAADQDPIMKMSQEKRALNDKLRRMEAEMEQVFEMKVREKKKKLHDSEAELEQRALTMRKNQEAQATENTERARKFDDEVREWRQQYGHLEAIALSVAAGSGSPLSATQTSRQDGSVDKNAKKGKKFF